MRAIGVLAIALGLGACGDSPTTPPSSGADGAATRGDMATTAAESDMATGATHCKAEDPSGGTLMWSDGNVSYTAVAGFGSLRVMPSGGMMGSLAGGFQHCVEYTMAGGYDDQDAGGSFEIYDTVGAHDLTKAEPMTGDTGGTATAPNLVINVPNASGYFNDSYFAGFGNGLLQVEPSCAPCGSGTLTITQDDAHTTAGTFDATLVKVSGIKMVDTSTTKHITGAFTLHWK